MLSRAERAERDAERERAAAALLRAQLEREVGNLSIMQGMDSASRHQQPLSMSRMGLQMRQVRSERCPAEGSVVLPHSQLRVGAPLPVLLR